MNKIVLNDIIVNGNKIEYIFEVDNNLKKYFFDEIFTIEYTINDNELDLFGVDKSLMAIPFVCNIIAFVWLKDIKLILNELDADFYESIELFKKGYIEMYPNAKFNGEISVVNLIENDTDSSSNNSGLFFSGGMDAFCSLTRHIDENPFLISIWGADINSDNNIGWNILKEKLKKVSKEFDLDLICIHSTFRKILNTSILTQEFNEVLGDEWWHAVQHGPAIISHAAPLVNLLEIDRQYIASSFCPQDGKVTCCSYPTIDNNIKMGKCTVIHDGFELSRMDKAKQIDRYRANNKHAINLHVCWKRQDGENCCKCEKCLRTMAEFWSFGAEPRQYGFYYNKTTFSYMKKYLKYRCEYNKWLSDYWVQIQKEMLINKEVIKKMPYYRKIKWLEHFDFSNPEALFTRKIFKFASRCKNKLSVIMNYRNILVLLLFSLMLNIIQFSCGGNAKEIIRSGGFVLGYYPPV